MDKLTFGKGIADNLLFFMGMIEGLSGKQVDAFVESRDILKKISEGSLTIIEVSVLDDLESNQKQRRSKK